MYRSWITILSSLTRLLCDSWRFIQPRVWFLLIDETGCWETGTINSSWPCKAFQIDELNYCLQIVFTVAMFPFRALPSHGIVNEIITRDVPTQFSSLSWSPPQFSHMFLLETAYLVPDYWSELHKNKIPSIKKDLCRTQCSPVMRLILFTQFVHKK